MSLFATVKVDANVRMPIMDGKTAATEIRKLESKPDFQQSKTSLRVDDRIPIIAVSASLYESDRGDLAADFDGWLLKPLDFGRVRDLFKALQDPELRKSEVYRQGRWERGGYFHGMSTLHRFTRLADEVGPLTSSEQTPKMT